METLESGALVMFRGKSFLEQGWFCVGNVMKGPRAKRVATEHALGNVSLCLKYAAYQTWFDFPRSRRC